MKARDFFLENWGVKLTALFLALILWVMVHGDPGMERNISVPLEIRIPRDMIITNDDRPSLVEVGIRGPLVSGSLGQPSVLCLIDLLSAPEGSVRLHLPLKTSRQTPPGCKFCRCARRAFDWSWNGKSRKKFGSNLRLELRKPDWKSTT